MTPAYYTWCFWDIMVGREIDLSDISLDMMLPSNYSDTTVSANWTAWFMHDIEAAFLIREQGFNRFIGNAQNVEIFVYAIVQR